MEWLGWWNGPWAQVSLSAGASSTTRTLVDKQPCLGGTEANDIITSDRSDESKFEIYFQIPNTGGHMQSLLQELMLGRSMPQDDPRIHLSFFHRIILFLFLFFCVFPTYLIYMFFSSIYALILLRFRQTRALECGIGVFA